MITLYAVALPAYFKFLELGALEPRDFDGVTYDVDSRSQQAYDKAKARAELARGPGALPYILWSHDESCKHSSHRQLRAWVMKDAKRLWSKCNSGSNIMAAELVCIWDRGYVKLTDDEFAEARSHGYDGPQRSLMLFEISRDDSNVDLAKVLAEIGGESRDDDEDLVVVDRATKKLRFMNKPELIKLYSSMGGTPANKKKH